VDKPRQSFVSKPATRQSLVATTAPSTPYVSTIANTDSYTPYSRVPPHIPTTLEFEGDNDSFNGSTIGEDRGFKIFTGEGPNGSSLVLFKVSSPSGATHRVRCALKVQDLLESVSNKIGVPTRSFQVQYEDDEGDTVLITTDDDVSEAWNMAKKGGNKIVKVTAILIEKKKADSMDSSLLYAGVGVLGFVGILAFVMLRPRK
jgi:PB1 domain